MGKASKTPVRVKIWVSGQPPRQQPSHLSKLLTLAMISGAVAIVASGIGLAARLIVDPASVSWVHWLIPGWNPQPLSARILQTRSEIEAEAATAGLLVGAPLYFSTYPGLSGNSAGFEQLLLPFYKTQSKCQPSHPLTAQVCNLAELRVYRPRASALHLPGKASTLELVDRLPVTGPEELSAISPLVNADLTSQGSTRRLPLTAVSFINGSAPLPGIWLHLSGEWQRGSHRTRYGQVVRYDPSRDRLQSLLAWTSPTAHPSWQQVTGGDATELVVDQTIGLEPQFQIYQFAALNTPGRPIQVKPIDLRQAMLDNRTYANGLLLARHGLWSTALQVLEQSRKTDSHWSATAQSQLDLVALHANITQAQAKRDWASPAPQITALLIDGRWSEALTVLRTAHANGYTTANLLSRPSDRLWNRVEAAARVNPRPDVLNWGVLLMAVRQDRAAALAWLQKQPRGDRQAEQILALLDPLPITTVASSPPPTSSTYPIAPTSATIPVSTAPSTFVSASNRIIGSAVPQDAIDPTDWFRPDPTAALTLAPHQRWYEIQVIGFQEGLHWQQASIPDPILDQDNSATAQMLWHHLGLSQAADLQLITWTASAQPNIQLATVKAVRVIDGTVWLLAMAKPIAAPPANSSVLAMTLDTLPWVEPLSTATLTALSQQPEWAATLIPALWQALQQTPQFLPTSVTSPAALLQEFGGWSVQLMELTGDDRPEAVLTLQPQPSLDQANTAAQTLIFSTESGLLYSDLLQEGRSLKAVANLGDGNPPALIISTTQGYGIERWSAQNRQFE